MPDLARSFAALGDPVRFAIVERLLTQGARSAGELQDLAEISPPAMSRHLRVLREAGLVERRVDGPRRIYSANGPALAEIGAWTISHQAFWAASLDRLETLLGKET